MYLIISTFLSRTIGAKDTFPRSKFSIIVIFLNEGKFRTPPPPPTGEANKLWSQLTEPVSQLKIFSVPSDSQ